MDLPKKRNYFIPCNLEENLSSLEIIWEHIMQILNHFDGSTNFTFSSKIPWSRNNYKGTLERLSMWISSHEV
jgi:hypothetical protein